MKLNLRGHEDRYAIEQSLLAFFPEERPVYEGEDGDSHAEVTLHEGNVYATGVTTLTYGGKTARGEARVRTAGVSDAYERERLRQRALKLSFFRAARDVTGVTPSWGALTGIRPAKLVRTMLEDGMTPAQADRVLRDTYCVSPARRRLALESAEAGLKARSDLRPEDISLYIGIPFCPTRCAYCSFVSASVEKSFKLMEPYLAALTAEVEAAGRMVKDAGLRIKSFYMGGGTPTTLSASQMDALLTAVNRNFDLSDCVEYCIEAGRPDTIDREKLQVLLDHGADRIITVHTLSLKKGSRILLEGLPIPSAEDVAAMLDYADPALREKGFAPYYLYRQKYMSGSFENVGWCISGAEGLYNIYIMEELHSILSLGAGGSTKMVDAKRNRIERVFHPKFPLEYIQRPEKLTENLEAFRRFHQEMAR